MDLQLNRLSEQCPEAQGWGPVGFLKDSCKTCQQVPLGGKGGHFSENSKQIIDEIKLWNV